MAEATAAKLRDEHLFGPGPKRILALDGGGIRGAISLAFLERLEVLIAQAEGRPVRLCDWFDLIGGTSTGSIIATGLALGHSAAEIRKYFHELAPSVFRKAWYRMPGWRAKFDSRRLLSELDRIVGCRTLDTPDLATGLCIVLKRMDTGSPWLVMNNPRSEYWGPREQHARIGNRGLLLANLVRASTAAPGYFDPEWIAVSEGQPPGLFVDGGLTPHYNPSFALLMLATLPPFGLNWRLGEEQLTIFSIGTGSFRARLSARQASRIHPLTLAFKALAAQISDNQQFILTLMSWLGRSPVLWPINAEIGAIGAITPEFGKQFRFVRYDVRLERDWLKDELAENVSESELRCLQHMDDPRQLARVYQLGAKAAAMQVKRADWEGDALPTGSEAR